MNKEKDYSYLSGDPDDGFTKIDPTIREKFNNLPDDVKAKSLAAKTFILYPFEMYEQMKKPFKQKDAETLEFIMEHLKAFDKPFIATSFGSDSIVLMHLVMRACKKLGIEYPDMFLNDTLNTFKEEKQYWADMIKLWGIQDKVRLFKPPMDKEGRQQTVWSIAAKVGHLPSFRSIRKKKDGKNKTAAKMGGSKGRTPECCDILKKKSMKKFMNELPEKDRYNLSFVGTRAQESNARSNSILQRCRTSVLKTFLKYKIRNCTPLGFWTMEDTQMYYYEHGIPKNPAYKAHDMERMGCASCPAHLGWATRLAKDPTNEGFGMLKQNFKILKETEANGTEREGRLQESVDELKRFLKKPEGKKLTDIQRDRINNLISLYTNIT
jgi:3'-phosphoadenosine 5'-phosphosulfate sulfotransferase (PAPS reductase)/FAD synthetase